MALESSPSAGGQNESGSKSGVLAVAARLAALVLPATRSTEVASPCTPSEVQQTETLETATTEEVQPPENPYSKFARFAQATEDPTLNIHLLTRQRLLVEGAVELAFAVLSSDITSEDERSAATKFLAEHGFGAGFGKV